MADEASSPANRINQLDTRQKFGVAVGIAALIALLSSLWMWGQTPEYRVLYSNLSDRDGGAIIESLQQQNIPYKFSDGGGALMVPANMVYETRLKMATLGLPKGGNVGFELMENQKFGISQFAEQVNYQRALEGELARSVQSIASVQSARVHLAIPKPSVFVKEQQKPSASVVLTLNAGRLLDSAQVSAIVHLISSSVPDMSAKNVTVVDQSGTLLSANHEGIGDQGLDPNQLKYIQQIERSYVQRVEAILVPLLGAANVHAQITADVDFSQSEQTAEMYKPNQDKKDMAVRSQQTSEASSVTGSTGGVPGALSNQPPVPATAPLTTPAADPNAAPNGTPGSSQKEATTNFEVDRTIRHTKFPVGAVKRISVAVVVNNRKVTDSKGAVSYKPLGEDEKKQISQLVSEAVGYDQGRGDTLSVQNVAFNTDDKEAAADVPLWKQPEMIGVGVSLVKYLLIAIVMLIVVFGVIKPALKPLISKPAEKEEEEAHGGAMSELAEDGEGILHTGVAPGTAEPQQNAAPAAQPYEQGLQAARQIAQQDPKIVASVIKEWVNGNE